MSTLREALERLAKAEEIYRQKHDLHGDGSLPAGMAWDNLRRAGDIARAALTQDAGVGEPPGWKLVPIDPTDEMVEAAMDESGWRVEPYTAPRESGVAVECDMSEEDAAYINDAGRQAHADTYRAMLAAAPSPPEREVKP